MMVYEEVTVVIQTSSYYIIFLIYLARIYMGMHFLSMGFFWVKRCHQNQMQLGNEETISEQLLQYFYIFFDTTKSSSSSFLTSITTTY